MINKGDFAEAVGSDMKVINRDVSAMGEGGGFLWCSLVLIMGRG